MNVITDPTTGNVMEYRHLIANEKNKETRKKADSNKLFHMMNGLQQLIKGSKTMHFIVEKKSPNTGK